MASKKTKKREPRLLHLARSGAIELVADDAALRRLAASESVRRREIKRIATQTKASKADVRQALNVEIVKRLTGQVNTTLATPAPPAPPQTAKPGDVSWDDFTADRRALDAATTLLAKETNRPWLDALEQLQRTADDVRRLGQPVTLAAVARRLPVKLEAIAGRVAKRDDAARSLEAAAQLAGKLSTTAPDPTGRVPLPPNTDTVTLLADPLAPARAYRLARQQGLTGGDDQAAFERSWRLLTDAGYDYVATLQADARAQSQRAAASRNAAQDMLTQGRQDRARYGLPAGAPLDPGDAQRAKAARKLDKLLAKARSENPGRYGE